jgi:hypothetical protein
MAYYLPNPSVIARYLKVADMIRILELQEVYHDNWVGQTLYAGALDAESLIFRLGGRQRNHFKLLCLVISLDDFALICWCAGGVIFMQYTVDIPIVARH